MTIPERLLSRLRVWPREYWREVIWLWRIVP